MAKLFIDSDVLIDFLRGDEKTREQLTQASEQMIPCCSVINIAEILTGMKKGEEEKTFDLIDSLSSFPVTQEIAELAGELKRTIRSHSLELDDCLIAATVLTEGGSLLTKNKKHYPMKDLTLSDL